MIKSKVENIKVGYREYKLERVSNIDDLLERVETEDDIPFWAELWPGSLGLSEALIRERLDGKKILELGTGLGLPGIVARGLGAIVTQTDYKEEALEWAKKNSQHNGIEGISYNLLDWRRPISLGQFDYIIGSDILYEPKLYIDLIRVIESNILDTGEIIISDPGRAHAIEFLKGMQEKGWLWDEEKVPVNDGLGFRLINVYRLRKINC